MSKKDFLIGRIDGDCGVVALANIKRLLGSRSSTDNLYKQIKKANEWTNEDLEAGLYNLDIFNAIFRDKRLRKYYQGSINSPTEKGFLEEELPKIFIGALVRNSHFIAGYMDKKGRIHILNIDGDVKDTEVSRRRLKYIFKSRGKEKEKGREKPRIWWFRSLNSSVW